MRASDLIASAARDLLEAETRTDCSYCRSHVRDARVVIEDLAAVARMGEDIARHAELARIARRLSQIAERIGGLSMIARVVHKVKGATT